MGKGWPRPAKNTRMRGMPNTPILLGLGLSKLEIQNEYFPPGGSEPFPQSPPNHGKKGAHHGNGMVEVGASFSRETPKVVL